MHAKKIRQAIAVRTAVVIPVIAIGALLAGCSSSSDTAADTTVAAGAETTVADTTPADSTPVETTLAGGGAETTVAAAVKTTIAGATASTGSTGSTVTTVAPAEAVTDISIQPGLSKDGFVGAASDVTTKACAADGAGWSASGTVTNKTGAAASYRIYVAFNAKGTTDTRGLVQTDVKVAKGATESWKATAELADKDLICILRVERSAAS